MMLNPTVYIFYFSDSGSVTRIPYAKWIRIRSGKEIANDFAGQSIHIAYAYILLNKQLPDYCPRIEGGIYYFDKSGRIENDMPYFDLFKDLAEDSTGNINLMHRKKKKEYSDKYCWQLDSNQIQLIIDTVWKKR